jgi:hypothetical protein
MLIEMDEEKFWARPKCGLKQHHAEKAGELRRSMLVSIPLVLSVN